MKWKTMSIGKKLAVGFGIVLILLIAVVIESFTGVGHIVTNAKQTIEGNQLDGVLAQKEVDHLNWVEKVNTLLADESVTTLDVQTDDHKCGFGKWLYGQERTDAETLVPGLASLFREIEEPHRQLHESAIAIGRVFKQADAGLPHTFAKREVDHLKWAAAIRDALLHNEKTLDVETDPEKCALGKWLHSEEAEKAYVNGDAEFKEAWDALVKEHEKLHKSAVTIQNELSTSREAALQVFETETAPVLETTLKLLADLEEEGKHELAGMEEAERIYTTQTIPALEEVQHLLAEIRQEARENIMTDEVMLDAAQGTKRTVTAAGVAAVILGFVLAFVIARGITKAIIRVVAGLSEGADQVASASSQMSSASQNLAEGASEQAASIEETSSALEEMSATTHQNAENAGQADMLMKEAGQVVSTADRSMDDLKRSMEEISKASEETFKIIKTIDEIAFQTNLLALNAAVEAARAGDAGAGFAVVADEVRNLALRAADAAKNTAALIEKTVNQVKACGDVATHTNENFSEVVSFTTKVGALVAEIATASNEQAEGLSQVNTAVHEVDKVTQSNAANAEEAASVSEEMNAQAMQMRRFVADLAAMVGGNNNGNGGGGSRVRTTPYGALPKLKNMETAAMPIKGKTASSARKGVEVSPEKLIPMEENDFMDF